MFMLFHLEKHEWKLISGQVYSNEVIESNDWVAVAKGKTISEKDTNKWFSVTVVKTWSKQPYPHSQKASHPTHMSTTFFIRMLVTFLERTLPASNSAKPNWKVEPSLLFMYLTWAVPFRQGTTCMKSIMAPMSTKKRSFMLAFSILMSATGSNGSSATAGIVVALVL